MKKIVLKVICFIIIIQVFAVNLTYAMSENDDIKRDLLTIFMAYGDYIKTIEKSKNNLIYFVMDNGEKVLYDDKEEKSFDERFYNTDLQDMLYEKYPLKRINEVMPDNCDPGRFRNYTLLNSVYGSSRQEIEKNLISISTKYGTTIFNGNNGAAENLKNALNEIWSAAEDNGSIHNFISPINGTYNYRVIQGTGMLSCHSYGIAIDLNRNNNDYWKWVSKEKGSERIKIYPQEIVNIFEKHGFVWGGKWSHFDILHFEYKPEILLKAKYFGDDNNVNENVTWYNGVPNDERVQQWIKIINDIVG